ncbi:MAG: ribose-phosphate pyrophosphokinase [Thaumarchaeota archaeon]|nr:ribose-phosphate pyrophosphokinase [Nitrososphaerota archaeon]
MGDKLVLPGPASEDLGKAVASNLGLEIVAAEFKVFPDGETRFTSDQKVSGKSVIIVQSTYPPIDQHLFQLLLASHCLSQEGARVTAVVPYLAYARQDKAFLPGEGVTLGVVSHLMRSAGVRRLATVDIHSVEGLSLFSFPAYSVSAVPTLVGYANDHLKLSDPVVISPDFGGSKRTEAFAALYGAKFLKLEKSRDRVSGEVRMKHGTLDVKRKEVLILDDIISTGGTIRAAAETVMDQGASKVIALCVHGLFVGDSLRKLEKAGVKTVVGTNTVPGERGVVDVSEAIASHLKTLEE